MGQLCVYVYIAVCARAKRMVASMTNGAHNERYTSWIIFEMFQWEILLLASDAYLELIGGNGETAADSLLIE